MAVVKSAVSLDEELYARVEEHAKQRRISRSRLHALALEDYLRKQETRELLESWNAASAGSLDAEDRAWLEDGRAAQEARTRDDEW